MQKLVVHTEQTYFIRPGRCVQVLGLAMICISCLALLFPVMSFNSDLRAFVDAHLVIVLLCITLLFGTGLYLVEYKRQGEALVETSFIYQYGQLFYIFRQPTDVQDNWRFLIHFSDEKIYSQALSGKNTSFEFIEDENSVEIYDGYSRYCGRFIVPDREEWENLYVFLSFCETEAKNCSPDNSQFL